MLAIALSPAVSARPAARRFVGVLAIVLVSSGCAAFMAGYRTSSVHNIALGMTTAGVLGIAGQPQRRDAASTPSGSVEVWYYTVTGPGGGLDEQPIVFANGHVVAVGRDGMKALVEALPANAPPQPAQAGAAPQAQGQPPQPVARPPDDPDAAVRAFYDANPNLRGREKCVARAFASLSDRTWENLATTAHRFCVPGENWVNVFIAEDGRSSYVDATRIEFREGNQASYWTLSEVFDAETDFFVSRKIVDCDKRVLSLLEVSSLTSGQYRNAANAPLEWESPLPNTQAETIMIRVCNLRTTQAAPTRPADPPRSTQPENVAPRPGTDI